jgi:hypothetical protein
MKMMMELVKIPAGDFRNDNAIAVLARELPVKMRM